MPELGVDTARSAVSRVDRLERHARSLLKASPAAEPRRRRLTRSIDWRVWHWPGWVWGALLGLGMIVGGIGAAGIAIGPVVLPYDEHFVGRSRSQLEALNPDLFGFMRHDRVSMAGAMVAIGVLYLVAAVWGQREGAPWGRQLLLASGTVGFASFFLFLGFGYFDPLHGTTTAVLFPVFLLAVLRDRPQPSAAVPEPRDDRSRRTLVGQVGIALAGVGLLVGGVAISWVGTHGVFVPSDLAFLHDRSARLTGGDARLLPLLAHDRAGFGGALISFAVGLLVLVGARLAVRRLLGLVGHARVRGYRNGFHLGRALLGRLRRPAPPGAGVSARRAGPRLARTGRAGAAERDRPLGAGGGRPGPGRLNDCSAPAPAGPAGEALSPLEPHADGGHAGAALEVQPLGQRQPEPVDGRAAVGEHRLLREGGQDLGEFQRPGHGCPVRDHLGDQADRLASTASITRPVRIRSRARPSPTMRGRRWVPPSIRAHPSAVPRQPKRRPAGRDPQVAPEGQLEPAGDAPTVDRGDRRLARGAPGKAQRSARTLHPGGERFDRLEVGAGAEGLVAGAGEDQHPRVGVRFEALERLLQRVGGRSVDRVPPLRPIDRHERGVAVPFVADLVAVGAHGPSVPRRAECV